jgi:predicted kinase
MRAGVRTLRAASDRPTRLGRAGAKRRPEGFGVIVRGPLGVGKTTVARLLARRIGGAYVSVDRILEEHGLWEAGRLSEFLRANAVAAREARPQLSRGTPVVFDGNFYWKSQISDLIERLAVPVQVFTLTAPLAVCVDRDRRRALSYGAEATAQVFSKATRFSWGVEVDARRPLRVVVRDIDDRLARSAPTPAKRS